MALTFKTGSFKKRFPHIAFYLGFLSRAFMKHRTTGKEENISLTPLYHVLPLHKHSDIKLTITAESSRAFKSSRAYSARALLRLPQKERRYLLYFRRY